MYCSTPGVTYTLDPSVQNFIANPDRYLLRVNFGKKCTLAADSKGLWTWLKVRVYEWFGYGSYNLSRACAFIDILDATPEHTPLRQAANKVIAKWNARHDWCLDYFGQHEVTVRPGIELTTEKVLELANRVIEDREAFPIEGFNEKKVIIKDIERHCNEGILQNPEIYIDRWIRQRGGNHNYIIPDDASRDFFDRHIFDVKFRLFK